MPPAIICDWLLQIVYLRAGARCRSLPTPPSLLGELVPLELLMDPLGGHIAGYVLATCRVRKAARLLEVRSGERRG